jgi:hypothetical protein
MKKTQPRKAGKIAVYVLILYFLTTTVSAGYLDAIILFVCELKCTMMMLGNTIAAVMFVYGGAKYAYTADDPGGRKQGITICVAALMAWLIIGMGDVVIKQIASTPGFVAVSPVLGNCFTC